jgi:hypothetical protein
VTGVVRETHGLIRRLSFWCGFLVILLYAAVLIAVFVRYKGCLDECHGGLVIPLFFTFLVPIGAGLIRFGTRDESTVGRWGPPALWQVFWVGVTGLAAALLLVGVFSLMTTALDLVSAATGWGLAPPGEHPDASDRLRSAAGSAMLAGFFGIVGLSSLLIGYKNGRRAVTKKRDN